MLRNESDKDDLIADAVALVDRAEYQVPCIDPDSTWLVTAGFRNDCSLSVYFDQDPFYQFASDGLLRRSYADGYLYRSQGDTLAKLRRERSPGQTTLMRIDLAPDELRNFAVRMKTFLSTFRNAIQNNTAQRLRAVTELQDFDAVLIQQLDTIVGLGSEFLSRSINKRTKSAQPNS